MASPGKCKERTVLPFLQSAEVARAHSRAPQHCYACISPGGPFALTAHPPAVATAVGPFALTAQPPALTTTRGHPTFAASPMATGGRLVSGASTSGAGAWSMARVAGALQTAALSTGGATEPGAGTTVGTGVTDQDWPLDWLLNASPGHGPSASTSTSSRWAEVVGVKAKVMDVHSTDELDLWSWLEIEKPPEATMAASKARIKQETERCLHGYAWWEGSPSYMYVDLALLRTARVLDVQPRYTLAAMFLTTVGADGRHQVVDDSVLGVFSPEPRRQRVVKCVPFPFATSPTSPSREAHLWLCWCEALTAPLIQIWWSDKHAPPPPEQQAGRQVWSAYVLHGVKTWINDEDTADSAQLALPHMRGTFPFPIYWRHASPSAEFDFAKNKDWAVAQAQILVNQHV